MKKRLQAVVVVSVMLDESNSTELSVPVASISGYEMSDTEDILKRSILSAPFVTRKRDMQTSVRDSAITVVESVTVTVF